MSIFSTYSTGENRVTASILAVLRSLSLSRIERLLGAMLEQSEFELVKFQNQLAGGKVFFLSAPDSPDTLVLPAEIPNDKLDKSGKGTAFTMGQRYIASGRLLAAKRTSDLDGAE